MQSTASYTIIRKSELLNKFNLSNSTIYNRIADGLIPPPISLGGNAKGWLLHEVDAVMSAYIAGNSTESVKELVKSLIDARSQLVGEVA